jgi:hypothetical protein
MPQFDPKTEAGDYIAPVGLYERNKNLPFLGSLSCPRSELVAGEWTELQLVYTVGGSGLADGAWLKLAFKFYSDWALFQTSDPAGANYVSAEYHAGELVPGQSAATVQQLKVRFDQKGHERPFQKAVIIDIVDGYLNPGDRIVIRLGDRRQGGGGTRVQSFVEQGFRFRMFIDPLGSSKFAEVPGDSLIDIVPGAPASLQIVAPRLVGNEEAFDIIVRADDAWGNTCRNLPLAGTLRLHGPDGRSAGTSLYAGRIRMGRGARRRPAPGAQRRMAHRGRCRRSAPGRGHRLRQRGKQQRCSARAVRRSARALRRHGRHQRHQL